MASIRLTIEKLVEKGDGLARYGGKVVFVPQALPGEVVMASIVEQKGDYARARLDDIVEKSENRVISACPYYDQCGGCDLQHLAYESQVKEKESLLFENLRRIGKIERPQTYLGPVKSVPFAYRSRLRFHVDLERGTAGFLSRYSNSLVNIEHCLIATERLNRLLGEKRPLLLKAAKMRQAESKNKRLSSLIEVPAFEGDSAISLSSHDVQTHVSGHRFYVDSSVFFQANRFVLPEMVDFVTTHVTGDRVMDLYSGVGLFAAFLESRCTSVIAVEQDKRCLELARKHLGEKTEFFSEPVEQWSRSYKKNIDSVVVDPPRGGLDAQVVKAIVSWSPETIVYVSCNSVTLARDLKRFEQLGYKPEVMQMFDLYPQTSHVETIVMLSRE